MGLVERNFPSSELPSGVSDNDTQTAAGDQHNSTFVAAAGPTGQLLPLQDYVSGALDVLYYGPARLDRKSVV